MPANINCYCHGSGTKRVNGMSFPCPRCYPQEFEEAMEKFEEEFAEKDYEPKTHKE